MGSSCCCCNCCLLACYGLGFTYAWEVREGGEWEEYWEGSEIVSRRIRPMMVTDMGVVEECESNKEWEWEWEEYLEDSKIVMRRVRPVVTTDMEDEEEGEEWEEYWEDSKILLRRIRPIVADMGAVEREEEVVEGVDQEEEAEEGVDDEVQEEWQVRQGEEESEEGVQEEVDELEVMGEDQEEAEEETTWEEDEDDDLAEALEQSLEEYEPNMVPASETSIASLEKVLEGGEVLGLSCVVCMDDKHELAFSIMPCNHIFHTKCIETWLRISSCCPLCKYVMP